MIERLEHLIVGGGEMSQLIRNFDWVAVGLPPITEWQPTFLATVNLFLQSPVPIVTLWGEDGILIYNDAYSVFAGKRHPQLLGCKVVEGWPEVADFNRHVMNTVYHKGETLEYKDQELILYRNEKREQLWTDLTYSPVITEKGETIGVFAIVIETTERILSEQREKKTRDDLAAERERLQSVFSQAPALIAILRGPDLVFEMANPMYIKTVAPHRNIVGKPLLQAIPELEGQEVIKTLKDVLETDTPYVGEMSAALDRTGTGTLEEGYFSLSYEPIHDGTGGKPDGIFVHAVDITDQVLSRRRAENLNAELEAIFNSLPDGVITTDKTKLTHINERAAQILGFSSVEAVPTELSDFYSKLLVQYDGTGNPKIVDISKTSIGRALKGEIVDNGEVKVQNVDSGDKRIIRSAAAPIRNNDGEVIGTVATTSDITGQYELRTKMQKEIVRRRLLSQKTKFLKEQNEKLTVLNQTKDEFIALTSHQLRTPATGVKQYLGLVTEGFAGDISDQQRDFLEKAYESNDRQLQIIDDILRVARIDLDEIKITKSKQNIYTFIKNIISEQADTFANRQQLLEIDILDETMEASIDTRNLGMAVGNIIDNASKYTDDGKTITVAAHKKGRNVEIQITDQGVGIAAQDLSRLFQKFSRVHNDRSIQVGGTGLGLYLSQKLVEKHGGSIIVSSELGVGTTFTITVPV